MTPEPGGEPGPPGAAVLELRHPEDLRAAGYRDLLQGALPRAADRHPDVFVVEGTRTIRQLLDQRWDIESVLLSPARLHGHPDLAVDARRSGATVYTAAQDVFDEITGYHVHRGALALARRPAARTVESVVSPPGPVLVIEGVNDHENLGALFRNAAAFGAIGVILDPSAADPLYRRSVRVSLGHVLAVPFARAPAWPGELDRLRRTGRRVLALTPAGDVTLEEAVSAAGGANGAASRSAGWALMVGAEGPGLSPAALGCADVTVRIPMAAGVDSLNVATAAAVALSRLVTAAP